MRSIESAFFSSSRVLALIFVAFIVPLALYLLILSWINRRSRPLMVSGVWDFVGILFASSGFLLLGGPAILGSLSERWRMFWLLGEWSNNEGLASIGQFSVFLSILYFFVVILGSGVVFWRQRHLTSIYNVDPPAVENALQETCNSLGLAPIRSGNLFVFGLPVEGPRSVDRPQGIQAPHYLPLAGETVKSAVSEEGIADLFLGQNAILELEPFDAAMHMTLRWEPYDSPLRSVLETELDRRLSQMSVPQHDTALWLSLAGTTLVALAVMIVLAQLIRPLLGL
jgi:hypothetical protein